MTSKALTKFDLLALGFMTFAFFLGAGNIIFPPEVGLQAGEHSIPAMLGFLITAVGLPLLTLLAVAKVGGGLPVMTKMLPVGVSTVFVVAIYLIIGPLFAAPRTAGVAYEIGFIPFVGQDTWYYQLVYSIVYFSIVSMLSLHRGNLLDYIGKILTPALVISLLLLSIGVLVSPQGSTGAATGDYIESPLANGFLGGYNTLDLFGALIFGMLIVDILKKKGIRNAGQQTRYLVIAALVAAAGLAFVYISLVILGATSGGLVVAGAGGKVIIPVYVESLFGGPGAIILATVVTLACLTTAVGLVSACADYFSTRWSLMQYRPLVLLFAALCALTANVGLDQLIALSVPVLYALYPVCIALVALMFVLQRLPCARKSVRLVLSVAFVFALLDAAAVTSQMAGGIAVLQPLIKLRSALPLGAEGFSWLIPTVLSFIVSLMFKRSEVNDLSSSCSD